MSFMLSSFCAPPSSAGPVTALSGRSIGFETPTQPFNQLHNERKAGSAASVTTVFESPVLGFGGDIPKTIPNNCEIVGYQRVEICFVSEKTSSFWSSNYFSSNREAVDDFIARHPQTRNFLLVANKEIKKLFGDVKMLLDVYEDEDGAQLVLKILSSVDDDDRFSEIENELLDRLVNNELIADALNDVIITRGWQDAL